MTWLVGILRELLFVAPRAFNGFYRALPTARSRWIARRIVNVVQRTFTRIELVLHRRFKSTLGGLLASAPLLFLTTTGRRSGEPRTTPVVYVRDGEDFLIVAACGGLPWQPAWFLNLEADAEATIRVNENVLAARSVVVTGQERESLWPTMLAGIATLAKSATVASPRSIPLVRLKPVYPADPHRTSHSLLP